MSHEKTNSNLSFRLFLFVVIILIQKAHCQVSLAKNMELYILHIITFYRLVSAV